MVSVWMAIRNDPLIPDVWNLGRIYFDIHIQGVSGGIVNILEGGSMDYSE